MATITGRVVNSPGANYAGLNVTFTARDALIVPGSRLIVPTVVTAVADGSGNIAVTLQPGVYQVDAGIANFAIEVPDDSNVYDIGTVAMPTLTYTPPVSSGSSGTSRGTGADFSGTGSPEGSVVGRPGDHYVDLDPSLPAPLEYVKKTGYDTTTGWI